MTSKKIEPLTVICKFSIGTQVHAMMNPDFTGYITLITLSRRGMLYEVSGFVDGTPGSWSFYEFELYSNDEHPATQVGFW